MRRILLLMVLVYSKVMFAQDYHEQKFSLGNTSANKWYKLCIVDFPASYNSVVVDFDFYYVNTWTKYASKAYLRFRETPSATYADWQMKNQGVNTPILKLKKVSPRTYELWGYSNSSWGHMAIAAKVTKESSSLSFTIPANPTEISDPNAFEDVSYKGDWNYLNGNVLVNESLGIGTIDPGTYKLAVKGKIRAEEIKVETGWADYVFKDDYDLPTLEEVEKHIQQRGHLINIPSAAEVEENGIQLGEMNKLLLEKIEELTLYTLQQEQRIELLENTIKQLQE